MAFGSRNRSAGSGAPRLKRLPGFGDYFVESARRLVRPSLRRSRGAPHVRDALNVQAVWNAFVVASIPAWFIGLWNVGRQANLAARQIGLDDAFGWRSAVIEWLGLGTDPFNPWDCWVLGALFFVPALLAALAAGAFWEALFARLRRRPLDEGLPAIAWLFVLMMPPTVAVHQVIIGMSVAMVFGKLVFGGSGRYLVNPPLLGLVFLMLSYPDLLFGVGAWVPVAGFDQPTVIELVSGAGGLHGAEAAGYRWEHLFWGDRPGPFGTTSVAAIIVGLAYLLLRGLVSWRAVAGSIVGMVLAVALLQVGSGGQALSAVPWYWHLLLGGFAFGMVFIATDPVAGAITNPGRWIFGLLVGALTVLVRLASPSYHEGVVFAILLASTFSPLIDHFVVRANVRRRQRRVVRPEQGMGPHIPEQADHG